MPVEIIERLHRQWCRIFREWKWSTAVGASAALVSILWTTAVTLQNAAYVRALGQIELVFTFLSSWLIFREQTTAAEAIGISLVAVGIVLILLQGKF